MTVRTLTPYLFFNGDAERAIAHYTRVLGAQTHTVMRFGDHPSAGQGSPEVAQRVMHAEISIGQSRVMISDCDDRNASEAGDNVQLTLDFEDLAEMTRCFEALAADGGKISVALHDTFWGARFGCLTDAFGVSWIFNCQLAQLAS